MEASWDPRAVRAYAALVGDRLRSRSCPRCQRGLESAILRAADDGTTLEEYRLGEVSTAQVLAATQRLTLICGHCGAAVELGELRPLNRTRASEAIGAVVPWDTEVLDLYQALIRTRLSERNCPACNRSLEASELVSATGGTSLDDYAVSDAAAARMLAATQRLEVRCGCGERSQV